MPKKKKNNDAEIVRGKCMPKKKKNNDAEIVKENYNKNVNII